MTLFKCKWCSYEGSAGWHHVKNNHPERIQEFTDMVSKAYRDKKYGVGDYGKDQPVYTVNAPNQEQQPSIDPALRADIEHRFAYHKPGSKDVIDAHSTCRLACGKVALLFAELCPDGRETELAITHLEEAMMWANAAIARHHPDNKTPEGT